MRKDININQLATAVMHWLSYTSAIGRNYVLNEGAIKYPVCEYLERATRHEDDIMLEFGHPKLSMKRFDLFFIKKRSEKGVFEFKYIKNGSSRKSEEKQRIFNDLMRLHLFLSGKNKSYFLICGNQKDFVCDFQALKLKLDDTNDNLFITPRFYNSLPKTIESKGFYTEWFSFDNNNPLKTINLESDNPEYRSIYNDFLKEHSTAYKIKTNRKLSLPKIIKTNLLFLTGNIEQTTILFQPSKIGIWEVTK